ncbi:hypothetical protein HDE_06358 [Halotydeus destructor]|nr:hypothetical protein HDE_06358 [Halotydeus destructor]
MGDTESNESSKSPKKNDSVKEAVVAIEKMTIQAPKAADVPSPVKLIGGEKDDAGESYTEAVASDDLKDKVSNGDGATDAKDSKDKADDSADSGKADSPKDLVRPRSDSRPRRESLRGGLRSPPFKRNFDLPELETTTPKEVIKEEPKKEVEVTVEEKPTKARRRDIPGYYAARRQSISRPRKASEVSLGDKSSTNGDKNGKSESKKETRGRRRARNRSQSGNLGNEDFYDNFYQPLQVSPRQYRNSDGYEYQHQPNYGYQGRGNYRNGGFYDGPPQYYNGYGGPRPFYDNGYGGYPNLYYAEPREYRPRRGFSQNDRNDRNDRSDRNDRNDRNNYPQRGQQSRNGSRQNGRPVAIEVERQP